MANDNKELKNNELCEDKQEARQLTEEELEQVTGGGTPVIIISSLEDINK